MKLKQKMSLWVGVLLSAVLMGCGGGQLHTRPEFKVGQRWSNQVTMKTWMQLPIGINDADTRDTAFRLDCKVREIDAEKCAHIEVTIRDIVAAMKSLNVQYSYDSKNDLSPTEVDQSDKNAQRGQNFSKTFADLLDQRYTVVVHPNGRAELGEVGEPIKAVATLTGGDNFGSEQAAVAFYEGYLVDYVAGDLFTGREAEAFEPNQVWTGRLDVRSPMTNPIAVAKTFNVDSVVMEDSAQVVVSYDLADDQESPKEQISGVMAKPSSKGSGSMQAVKTIGEGTAVYDLRLGRMVSKEDKMRVQVQTSGRRPAGERAERNKIFYVMTRKVEPVK